MEDDKRDENTEHWDCIAKKLSDFVPYLICKYTEMKICNTAEIQTLNMTTKERLKIHQLMITWNSKYD